MDNGNPANSFNSIYESSNFYFGLEPSEELVEFVEQCHPPQGATALDIGCGEGRDSLFLAEKGFSVLAIDVSQEGIEKLSRRARELGIAVEARCLDICSFDFPVECFHLVVAVTLLDHLDVEQILGVVQGIKRSIRADGIVFIEVFTVHDSGYEYQQGAQDGSECARFIKHYFEANEMLSYFQDWDIMRYEEKLELNESHGQPHHHGVAILIARKPK